MQELSSPKADSVTFAWTIQNRLLSPTSNETDAEARLAKMNALYQPNVAFFDPTRATTGIPDLNKRISLLQSEHPDFKFSLAKIDSSRNIVRYYWQYGPASNPRMISGMDLIVVDNGKIRSLNIFVDHAPVQSK